MKKPFLTLWLVATLCTAAGLPYAFELQRDVIALVALPFPLFILITLVQTALLLAVAIYLGKICAGRIGLRVFALRELVPQGGAVFALRTIARRAIPLGVYAAVAIFVADYLFLHTLTPELSVQTTDVTLWKTLLAAFYGGVVEEVLMRLFLVSLIAWILSRLLRPANPARSGVVMWGAIVVASVAFGLGHLPATASLTAITSAVVARAVVLNGIGGLIFGWLYWKKGLEYAILAHFTADIVLLVLLPALFT